MKKIYFTLIALLASINMFAQGWPVNYSGVMLQGFSWDSYDYSQWNVLEKQADDMKGFIDLVWLPQSGKCIETTQVMGYMPYYYFNQNSSFGTEAELRSLIAKFKANGIGAIADVVVNHRNTDGWYTFPAETYKGVTYQMLSTDICKNDDDGKTATQAKKDGVSLSNNYDEGTDFGGCRDIDHKSENVQKIIKAYLKFLKEDIGYTGFRYDMVKGFSGSHVADYNDATGVKFSVGEYWDGNPSIINWINKTNKKSAAFDFQFRYNVRDAVNGAANGKVATSSDWSKLNSNDNLMHDANYRRYAVTFVENHDTQKRSESEQNDPLRKDTIAANAYMLAMPGTPCVFQPHWRAYKKEIKSMIEARKLAGITNMSNYTNKMAQTFCFANETTGDKAKLIVVVGNNTKAYTPGADYTQILEGYHYRYYLSKSAETAWCNIPSGEYEAGFRAKLTAVSQNSNAKLVYTTDGTAPTAKSKQVATGSTINIDETCTLKVGLLSNGTVTGIRTYNYTVKAFEPYTITIYANADQVTNWGAAMYFYAWNSSETFTKAWPGTAVTATKTLNGKKWYYMDFKIKSKDAIVNIIFNQGNGTGKKQTIDLNAGNSTKYYEITTTQSQGKYTCKDVTAIWAPTGITGTPTISNTTTDNAWYTLSGMKLGKKPAKNGVYIHQGKKVIIR
ncbi:alpha-amylase family glycosyl hydrolase [Prevotella copri]|jgi:alpha-amylase|uniref:Alpha-amylase n=1 Tax=Segatella copri TaxID=165179 RepID=A0AAW5IR38_9BACT|nr:alpha-amylase family glycosyl hydrolase [Segatella copri]MCP9551549.1 alpha-amylase family glycosyl hydrolase [Segatella copri]MCP9572197.1 alpha-amylase family glycosyl hydrolase [Segatella copri]MCP9575284.1 alpha-amylase family glycosyl hydrolase [Segatella copri]MCP9578230.1 alpha-amylase family glycosyl hydrolase [Segatella copri]MCP9581292.1 alpha-amylase family glycosyl hydrolase [Segatella copri]